MELYEAMAAAGYSRKGIRSTCATVSRFEKGGYKPTERDIERFLNSGDLKKNTKKVYRNELRRYLYYLAHGYLPQPQGGRPLPIEKPRKKQIIKRPIKKMKLPERIRYKDSHSVMWR